MTDTAFVPRGRPVARFVAVVVLMGAVLAAIWATGAANPRLELAFDSWEGTVREGRAVLVVRNEGLTDARVHIVDVADAYVRLARDVPEVELDGGEVRRFTLHYVVDCPGFQRNTQTPGGATDPGLALVVRTKGPIGPSHQLRWGSDALSLGATCEPPLSTPG